MSETQIAQTLIKRGFDDELSERYLAYALSTITSRSLPDARDGLKPVHRRLLYAMSQLRLSPPNMPKKSARVVGDVIGRYHPHGDQSIYDALVRLAQDFSVRYPLVEGQGNFGNVDGDNAAAMRYTEARLTSVATALMEGLDEDAVDFRETYDGETTEPVVMPAAFPNLLANGSSGIAVGMATNIPPHNVAELCAALIHLIRKPQSSTDDLSQYVLGPDFPTGGEIVETPQTIKKIYETGRGSLRVRAIWNREDAGRGLWRIVVTEIPWQVQKSRLIEKIADLLSDRKLPMLEDVCDESAEDIRIVLVPKSRNIEPFVLMEQLFRLTDLETRFSVNMNVLIAGTTPKVVDLKGALEAYKDHRHEVLIRRSTHQLHKIEARLHILEGLLTVHDFLDEVIAIIRDNDEPAPILMSRFKLSEDQVEAVLNMRLRQIRKLEGEKLRSEHTDLSTTKDGLDVLLADEHKRWKIIIQELAQVAKTWGSETELGRRRTRLGAPPVVLAADVAETLVEKEPLTIVLSERGWLRAFRGHTTTLEEVRHKDGDSTAILLQGYTTDKLLLFAGNGRFYTLDASKLPGGRGFGEPVRLMVDLPNDAAIVTLCIYNPQDTFLLCSRRGRGFRVKGEDVFAQTKSGKQVLNLAADDEAWLCKVTKGDHLAIVGGSRKLLIFPLDELPYLTRGRGVILQKLKDGQIFDINCFELENGLSWRLGGSGERTRTLMDLKTWIGHRAGVGRTPPSGFPASNLFGL